MEAGTAAATGTGSKTMADMVGLAAAAVRRQPGAALQGRRGVDRRQLHRARRGGQRDRARADRPGRGARRQGRHRVPHPARVDVRPLRHPGRRRRLGLGLPDQLGRRVPLRARALRVRGRVPGGRRAAGEDPQRPRPPAQPAPDRPVRAGRGRGRRHHPRRAARARPGPRRRRAGGAHGGRDQGRRVHLHLHVRHHRPAQVLHPQPRQLPRRGLHVRGAGRPGPGRGRVPVPAAGPRVRQARAVPGRGPGRGAGLLGEGPAEDHPQPHGDQADVLPVGPQDLREDLHAGHLRPPRTRTSSSRPSRWA